MADSAYWRDLAIQFQAIDYRRQQICADWQYKAGSEGNVTWTLHGDLAVRVQFEALARRAAKGLPNKRSSDLLTAWLEAIREYWPKIEPGSASVATEQNVDYFGGSIFRVCEASVHICKKFESMAVQSEYEEEQRNDPKNWPQLLAQFEALKNLKDIINGPTVQMPESFVRNFVSDRDGIPPENVTLEQIQFEVAALLPYYPAITVIPTGNTATSVTEREDQQPPALEEKTKDIPATRKAFVEAILTEKGWSILDWANEARVAYHTAADYLAGSTRPYRSTRVKLAKALGILPNQLPE